MGSAERPNFVSVDAYLKMEEAASSKSEYIDGWIRAMTGATLRHNKVVMNCTYRLMQILDGHSCQAFNSDTKLRISDPKTTRYYNPDLQVVCDSNEPTWVFQDRAILIVEVLSPSTRPYDLDEKMSAYLSIPSLQCYIVLEQHQPIAIVMRRTIGGFLRECISGIDSTIALPFLDGSLSLQAIYNGIEFTSTCVQETEPEYDVSPHAN